MGNNNGPHPMHPGLKASLAGIELAVTGKLEHEDVQQLRTMLKLPDPSERHMDCQTSPRTISAEQ